MIWGDFSMGKSNYFSFIEKKWEEIGIIINNFRIWIYICIAVKQFDHQSRINWMNEMGGEVVYEIKWSNLKQFSNSYLKDGCLEAERQTVAERRQ